MGKAIAEINDDRLKTDTTYAEFVQHRTAYLLANHPKW
jgi:hypothetical protein